MKMLEKIKNFFKKKSKPEEVTIKPVDVSPSARLLRTLRTRENEENAMVTKKMAQEILEENVRKEFLPESPKVHPRTIRNKPTPAQHHHDAVAKFMKHSGSKHSQYYRKTTKHHTTDQELDNA